MLRRCFRRLYVKPPQGYISLLPQPAHRLHEGTERIKAARVLSRVQDNVPRRGALGDGADESAASKAAAASIETAAESRSQWRDTEPTDRVGVNGDSYLKWLCQSYNISRDQLEANGVPHTGPSHKQHCDDSQVMSELLNESQPLEVMKELEGDPKLNNSVYRRFTVDVLRSDGEVATTDAAEQLQQDGESADPDSPKLDQ